MKTRSSFSGLTRISALNEAVWCEPFSPIPGGMKRKNQRGRLTSRRPLFTETIRYGCQVPLAALRPGNRRIKTGTCPRALIIGRLILLIALISRIAEVARTSIQAYASSVSGTDILIKPIQVVAPYYILTNRTVVSGRTNTIVPVHTVAATEAYRRIICRCHITLIGRVRYLEPTINPRPSLVTFTYILHHARTVSIAGIRVIPVDPIAEIDVIITVPPGPAGIAGAFIRPHAPSVARADIGIIVVNSVAGALEFIFAIVAVISRNTVAVVVSRARALAAADGGKLVVYPIADNANTVLAHRPRIPSRAAAKVLGVTFPNTGADRRVVGCQVETPQRHLNLAPGTGIQGVAVGVFITIATIPVYRVVMRSRTHNHVSAFALPGADIRV